MYVYDRGMEELPKVEEGEREQGLKGSPQMKEGAFKIDYFLAINMFLLTTF